MMKVLIKVTSSTVPFKTLLGLPVIVRTVGALVKAGAEVSLYGPKASEASLLLQKWHYRVQCHEIDDPIDSNACLRLEAERHYDPDCLKYLIENKITRFNPSGLRMTWTCPLVDAASFGQARKFLLETIRLKTTGWVAPTINKRISLPWSAWLVNTSVTPNQITIANLIPAVVGAYLLISQSWLHRVIGAFLIALSNIIDGCDGEVAKLKLLSSKLGAWLDTISDDIINNVMLYALFMGLFLETHNTNYLKVGWITLFLSVGVTFFLYHNLLTVAHSGNINDTKVAWDKEKGKNWFEYVRPLMKRDLFITVVFFFVLFDWRESIFWMSVVGTVATFTIYLISFLQLMRQKLKSFMVKTHV